MKSATKTDRSPTTILDAYLHDIPRDALLTVEEERILAQAIARGDQSARDRMIQSNLRLVIKIARDFLGRGLGLDDLVGEGNLGLIRATETFDPSFGTRFSTYASYWIKQSIRHAIITTTATIRLPAHMVNLLTKWRRAERAFLRQYGYPPTSEQLAVILGLTDSKRAMVEHALQAGRLLPGGQREEEGSSLDEVPDLRSAPDAPLEADDDRRDLYRRLDRLDDRERQILTLRFGLDGQAPLTLKEVGRHLGITREWVRKIEVRALRKLEDPDAKDPEPTAEAAAPRRRTRRANRSRGTTPGIMSQCA